MENVFTIRYPAPANQRNQASSSTAEEASEHMKLFPKRREFSKEVFEAAVCFLNENDVGISHRFSEKGRLSLALGGVLDEQSIRVPSQALQTTWYPRAAGEGDVTPTIFHLLA